MKHSNSFFFRIIVKLNLYEMMCLEVVRFILRLKTVFLEVIKSLVINFSENILLSAEKIADDSPESNSLKHQHQKKNLKRFLVLINKDLTS